MFILGYLVEELVTDSHVLSTVYKGQLTRGWMGDATIVARGH